MKATSGPYHPKITGFNQQHYSVTNIILIINTCNYGISLEGIMLSTRSGIELDLMKNSRENCYQNFYVVTHSDWMEIYPVDSRLLFNWNYASQGVCFSKSQETFKTWRQILKSKPVD